MHLSRNRPNLKPGSNRSYQQTNEVKLEIATNDLPLAEEGWHLVSPPLLKTDENKVVSLELVRDPIRPFVTLQRQGVQNILIGQRHLPTFLHYRSGSLFLSFIRSSHEQCNRHFPRFEDVHYPSHQRRQIGGQAQTLSLFLHAAIDTVRAEGYISFETSIRTIFFGSDVDGPVSRIVVFAAAGHEGVRRVSAGFESECVEFCVGEKIGQTEFVGEGKTESVTFVEGGRFVGEDGRGEGFVRETLGVCGVRESFVEHETGAGGGREVRHEDFERLIFDAWCGEGKGSLYRRISRDGRGGLKSTLASHPEQPVVSVHLAYSVSRSMIEESIENGNFEHPIAMRTLLTLREHKTFSTVESVLDNRAELTLLNEARVGHGGRCFIVVLLIAAAVAGAVVAVGARAVGVDSGELDKASRGVETGKSLSRDSEKLLETKEKSGSSTSLEDELVREHKHGGFAQEISIDVGALDDAENFALDNVEHGLPNGLRDRTQSKVVGTSIRVVPSTSANVGRFLCKPQLQKLFGSFERTAWIMEVLLNFLGAATVGVDSSSDTGSIILELRSKKLSTGIHDLERLDTLSFFGFHQEIGGILVMVEVMMMVLVLVLQLVRSRRVRVETVSSSFEVDGGCHLGWWCK